MHTMMAFHPGFGGATLTRQVLVVYRDELQSWGTVAAVPFLIRSGPVL